MVGFKKSIYMCLLLAISGMNLIKGASLIKSDPLSIQSVVDSITRHDAGLARIGRNLILSEDATLNRVGWKLINTWDRNWRLFKATVTTAAVAGAGYFAYDRIKTSNQEKAAQLAKLQEEQQKTEQAIAAQKLAHAQQQKDKDAQLAALQKQVRDLELLEKTSRSLSTLKSYELEDAAAKLDATADALHAAHKEIVALDYKDRQEIGRLERDIARLREDNEHMQKHIMSLMESRKDANSANAQWQKMYDELLKEYSEMLNNQHQEPVSAPQKLAAKTATNSAAASSTNNAEATIAKLRQQLKQEQDKRRWIEKVFIGVGSALMSAALILETTSQQGGKVC